MDTKEKERFRKRLRQSRILTVTLLLAHLEELDTLENEPCQDPNCSACRDKHEQITNIEKKEPVQLWEAEIDAYQSSSINSGNLLPSAPSQDEAISRAQCESNELQFVTESSQSNLFHDIGLQKQNIVDAFSAASSTRLPNHSFDTKLLAEQCLPLQSEDKRKPTSTFSAHRLFEYFIAQRIKSSKSTVEIVPTSNEQLPLNSAISKTPSYDTFERSMLKRNSMQPDSKGKTPIGFTQYRNTNLGVIEDPATAVLRPNKQPAAQNDGEPLKLENEERDQPTALSSRHSPWVNRIVEHNRFQLQSPIRSLMRRRPQSTYEIKTIDSLDSQIAINRPSRSTAPRSKSLYADLFEDVWQLQEEVHSSDQDSGNLTGSETSAESCAKTITTSSQSTIKISTV